MWAKVLAYHTFGGPEVLELIRTWVPDPGPDQVRVRVKASGLNPIDGKLRSGVFSAGLPLLVPARLGSETSGVVDAVGENVEHLRVGDNVISIVPERTAQAEAVVAEAERTVVKPDHLSWEAAAAIPAGGITAYAALKEINVRPGDTVIVHGASGGVGSNAVQLAKLWGATTVIGTASEPNHDYLRELGAIPVTYGEGLNDRLREVVPKDGPVKILDAAGREAVADSIEFVGNPATDVISLLPFVDEEFGVQFHLFKPDGAILRELVDLYADGSLTLREPTGYPLADAARAHALLDTGHTNGKIVLRMD